MKNEHQAVVLAMAQHIYKDLVAKNITSEVMTDPPEGEKADQLADALGNAAVFSIQAAEIFLASAEGWFGDEEGK